MLTDYEHKQSSAGTFKLIDSGAVWKLDNTGKNLVVQKGDKSLQFDPCRRLIINLIGTSGSGKGTHGRILSQYYSIPHISVGDLFRDELRRKTEFSKLISLLTDSYSIDEICLGIISKRLAAKDCENGFVLDGFPRTFGQALVLINSFIRPDDIHVPVYMDLNEDIIKKRLQYRFICPSCGDQVRGHDSGNTGYCLQPYCEQVPLEHRIEDIDEFKLQKKFSVFNENKQNIFDVLVSRDKIHHLQLSGHEPVDYVSSNIFSIINQTFDQLYTINIMHGSVNRPVI